MTYVGFAARLAAGTGLAAVLVAATALSAAAAASMEAGSARFHEGI